MEKTTLAINNGKWRLHAVRTDRFKMSRLTFHFIMPKDARRSSMTKLMLSVMLRGSDKYPTVADINKRLDELYDTTVSLGGGSFGDKSVFTVSCKLIGDRFVFDGDKTDVLSESLELVSNVLTSPLCDSDGMLLDQYVESEKRIAVDTINSLINDQRAYAARECNRLMFAGTPYGIASSGDVETVNSFTAKELTENIDYFRKNTSVECYYIGSDSPKHVAELISKHFAHLSTFGADVSYTEHAFVSERTAPQKFTQRMDVSQTRICMGYTCGTTLCDDDYFPMLVANEIFGGSSVSKLFLNVREKKSLCYYCNSAFKSVTGTISVDCGVAPQNADAAIEEIGRQLEAFQNGELTDDEIETARRSLASGFIQISDSAAATEAFMLRRLLAGVEQSPEDCIAALRAVTREQILCAIRKVKLDTMFVLEGVCGEEADYE